MADPDQDNNQSSAVTTVVDQINASADLALVKTGPATVAGGGTIIYKLVVSNGGAMRPMAFEVSDLVPSVLSEVTWTCGNATGGAVCPTLEPDPQTGDVNLTIPTFPAGASLTITVTGTAPAAGAIVNMAQVLPPVGVADPDPSNNPGGPPRSPWSACRVWSSMTVPPCGVLPEMAYNGTEPSIDPVEGRQSEGRHPLDREGRCPGRSSGGRGW